MFSLTYMLAELRRRRGRTVVTALGLAVGVGLVVTVTALSRGLDDAQDEVLRPLTGVGTDLAVSRPIRFSQDGAGGPGFPRLSEEERKQLMEENGGARLGLRNLGEPGEKFSRDDFVSTSQLSFPAREVTEVRKLDGVSGAAGSLTLSAIHVEGTVPEQRPQRGFAPGGPGAGPESIDLTARTVTGVDTGNPALGAITPGQIQSGRYLRSAKEAVLNVAYARRQSFDVGDTIRLGSRTLTVVGLAKTPLGGQASDLYVQLGVLQKLSGREGRVNTIHVRAESADRVADVSQAISRTFPGSSVTTAEDLAERVSGSLVDARNLADTLGTALAVVALLAAFLIASLLTLSSVSKRVRELGTLKALGWPQRHVVRQVTGEALVQGLLGGLLGLVMGLAGAAAVDAFAPSLEATVEEAASAGPRLVGPFGQGAVETASESVAIDASISLGLVALAIALALLGGLVAGAAGGLRAARLRPADALRHLE